MALRQYSLLGLAITLVLTLTGQSGVAFTINYPLPDGRYDAFIYYNERDYEGEAYLVLGEEIERGGTNELWQYRLSLYSQPQLDTSNCSFG